MADEREADERAEIEAAKGAVAAHLLLKCARLLNERAVARVRARTRQEGLRPSHTQVFPHVDFEGTRLTTLAERLGTTKQAAGQLVDDLEAMGVLERVPDPNDGRAKLIRFSRRGRRAMLDGLGVLAEFDRAFERELGEAETQRLRRALARLLAMLEREPLDPAAR